MNFFNNPKVQVFSALLSLFIIFTFFSIRLSEYSFIDRRPEIKWNQPVKSVEFIGSKVKVGLSVYSFPEFEILKNRFVIDGTLWFEFDPTQISVHIVDGFSFEKGKILEKFRSDEKIIGNKILISYKIRVEFASSDLNFKLFPLDSHYIYLVLNNDRTTEKSRFLFDVDTNNFILPSGISVGDWKIIGKEVVAGYSQFMLSETNGASSIEHPRVIFSFVCVKKGLKKVIVILLPLLLLLFLGIFSFALETKKDSLNMAIATITALLAYRFVIETMSPSVTYFTLMDYIFLFVLSMNFSIFLINIHFIKSQKVSKRIDLLLFYSFQIIAIALFYFLLFIDK